MKFKKYKKIGGVLLLILALFIFSKSMNLFSLANGETFEWNNITFKAELPIPNAETGESQSFVIAPSISSRVSQALSGACCSSGTSAGATALNLNLCDYQEVYLDYSGFAQLSGRDCGGSVGAGVSVNGLYAGFPACQGGSATLTNPYFTKIDNNTIVEKDKEGDTITLTCPQYLHLSSSASTQSGVSASAGFTLNKITTIKQTTEPIINGDNTVYVYITNTTQLNGKFVCYDNRVVENISECASKSTNVYGTIISSIMFVIGILLLVI